MKYYDLINSVTKLETEPQFKKTEPFYPETMVSLEVIQSDIRKLELKKDVLGTIKDKFLVGWGRLWRVVNRGDIDWEGLHKRLIRMESDFAVLRFRNFRTIDFGEASISHAVKAVFNSIDIPLLKGITTRSHILHTLNPEIFVMWNQKIVKLYKSRNSLIENNDNGYLEFLKEMQKELKEAIKDRKLKTGLKQEIIELEIRRNFSDKTLARILDEYNHFITK